MYVKITHCHVAAVRIWAHFDLYDKAAMDNWRNFYF